MHGARYTRKVGADMSLLLVQLSDIHLEAPTDGVISRGVSIADAVFSEVDHSTEGCVLILCGDSTQAGQVGEFESAAHFCVRYLEQHLQ